MIEAVENRPEEAKLFPKPPPTVNIFHDRWLEAFGFALAALYSLYFIILYRAGSWIVSPAGLPIYTDFGNAWLAGMQALHGNAATLYNPTELAKVQAALFGATTFFYPNWPYPPTFFLVLAPLALLPYGYAFITWNLTTLLGCIAAVYLIVRQRAAIALALAAPFTAWNFLAAQNGFLTASLLGASLLLLERRPVLAGIFIGCLTYKPQFGILLPVALIGSRQWRAIASAAVITALLAGLSVALFGTQPWAALPRQLVAQTGLNLLAGPDSDWGYLQTVYGLIRLVYGSAAFAWLAQAATTAGLAIIVWFVWRSHLCYALKAATLSAAALIATPYGFAYDIAAIVIPAAFLASEQLKHGFLRGEKTMWIVLFGAPLTVLVTLGDNPGQTTFGGTPVGLFAAVMLLCMVLRRVFAPGSISAVRPAFSRTVRI
jgi:arabinofuranan 3-O-arabinosyltransferase